MHRYITAKFDTASDADAYAEIAKAARPTLQHGGQHEQVRVLRRKNLPPPVERRGQALHVVYDALESELTAGEEIKQVHEQRGPASHTDFFAKHIDTDELRPLATVWWTDTGSKVVLQKAEADQRLRAATKSALEKLMEA